MKSGFKKLFKARPIRVGIAFLAGIVSAISVLAGFGMMTPNFRHSIGGFSFFEVALLVAVPCGSAVAVRVLRSGRKQRPMTYRFW